MYSGGGSLSDSSYYDDVIKYWDEGAWRKYFSEDLGNLYRSCGEVAAISEFLKNKVDNRLLSEVLNEESLSKVLLGGLKEDGTYDENGLAVFCNRFFGTWIDRLDEFIGRLKAGMSQQEAVEGLTGTCKSTAFLNALSKVSGSLEYIVRQLDAKNFVKIETSKIDVKEIVKDPKAICEKVREFIQTCLSVSPNYNPYTFFITSLYRITRKYLEFAYPRLKDEVTFNFIRELLGLSEIITPQAPNERIVREYTVWGFTKGSIGCEIVENLVNSIWDLTELDIVQKYFNVKSERKIYLERAIKAWEKVTPRGKDWSDVATFIYNAGSSHSGKWGLLRLDDPHFYPRVSRAGFNFSLDGIILRWGERTISFTKFMDYISPQLFLNVGLINEGYRGIDWQAVVLIEQ
jgi:hypothetical protein